MVRVEICHISVTMLLAVTFLKIEMEYASIEILRSLKIGFVQIIKLIKLRNSGCGKSGKAKLGQKVYEVFLNFNTHTIPPEIFFKVYFILTLCIFYLAP